MAASTKVKTARALAAELGVSEARVSQMRRERWFPKKGAGGWDLDEVLAAVAKNVGRQRGTRAKGGPGAAAAARRKGTPRPGPAAPTPAPPDPEEERARGAAVEVLGNPEATALQQARAARIVAAQALARSIEVGGFSPPEYAALKKALEEQRHTERGWIDLAERRGELVERTEIAELGAELGGRLARFADKIETTFSFQVEIWLEDKDWLAMGSEERRRFVRDWAREQTRNLREIEAEETSA